jgi:hypothetical protein
MKPTKCVTDPVQIKAIIDNSLEITYTSARKKIGTAELHAFAASLGYKVGHNRTPCKLSIQNDYRTKYYQNTYQKATIVYIKAFKKIYVFE